MAKKPETPAAEPAPEPVAAPVVTTTEPAYVWFESREQEVAEFDIAGYRANRQFGDGRVYWRVKAEDVERFASHHHVVTGRVVRRRG